MSAVPLLPVTGIFLGVFGLLLLALAWHVIRKRRSARIGLGDGGDKRLLSAIRIHGNFAEYVPMAMLLMAAAELNRARPSLLYGCGVVLVAARVAHAWGLNRSSGASTQRVMGTVGTFAVIATLAVSNLWIALR